MSELTAMVLIVAVRAIAVSAAVGVACFVTGSGWPLLGLCFAGGHIRYDSDGKTEKARREAESDKG